jgi:hypothetical protein
LIVPGSNELASAVAGREADSGMNGYVEPVRVQARDDGRPVRFVWRDRLYTVRAILEHWVINVHEDRSEPQPGQLDLEFWRVQATPGPGTNVGIYELRRETATGAWSLRRGVG